MCTTLGAKIPGLVGSASAVEDEARFHVQGMDVSVLVDHPRKESIRQHYIPLSDGSYMRVREKSDRDVFTVKRGWGRRRDEPELTLINKGARDGVAKILADIRLWGRERSGFPQYEINELARMAVGALEVPAWIRGHLPLRTLVKTRYHFDGGWSLDIYHDPEASGLVVLECEGDDAETAAANLPNWVHKATEITSFVDNSIIARWIWERRMGLSPWTVTERMIRIKRASFDGGPGCGKTTLIKKLRESARYRDRVVIVPEAARLMHEYGLVNIPVGDPCGMASFEGAIYRQHQILLEQAENEARRSGRGLIVEDRHPIHPLCYLDGNRELFETACGTTVERELAQGDVIIYLEMPPREIYDAMKSGDPTRYEDYDQALQRDRQYQAIYAGFGERLVKVPFFEDFTQKEGMVFAILDEILAR